jgi:hypothetical protein
MLRALQADLEAPFATETISWRVGSTNRKKFDAGKAQQRKGQALAYIDARDVMDRLDGVMVIAGWQARYPDAGNGKTCCEIGLYLDGQWIWKGDGAGDTNMEGDKGAFSDALKRAAVRWGIGRYLYDLRAPWLVLDEWWSIQTEDYDKLNKMHDEHAASVGMSTPAEKAAIRNLVQTIKTSVGPTDVERYRTENAGMLHQLRKAQREYVEAALDQIANQKEPA